MEAEEVNGLRYTDTIFYVEDSNRYKMVIEIRMNDECKNKVCEFAITADMYELHRSRWKWHKGGCCHDEILKHAPKYKCFVDLHLCNHYGYGGINSFLNADYWFRQGRYDNVKECLRLNDEELDEFLLVADDKQALLWKLNKMGIIERWKKEAEEAIEYLEKLTNKKWVNPYTPDEERFVMKPLTGEENELMEQRFNSGYYSKEEVTKRRKAEFDKRIEYQKDEARKDFNEKISKYRELLNIKLSILNEGVLLDNVFIRVCSSEVEFNCNDYKPKVSREEFNRCIEKLKSLDYFDDYRFIFRE